MWYPLERSEYITLRLIRRFILSGHVRARLARFLPYIGGNSAEDLSHCDKPYSAILAANGLPLRDQVVLESGVGATCLMSWILAAKGARSCHAIEPFVAFDPDLDRQVLDKVAKAFDCQPEVLRSKVRYARDLQGYRIPVWIWCCPTLCWSMSATWPPTRPSTCAC